MPMNDFFCAPLRKDDPNFFADSKAEKWILLYGRLIDRNKLQVVSKNNVQLFTLLGNIEDTKEYDCLILGHTNDDATYVYVINEWELRSISPFLYDASSPIPFAYLDPDKTIEAPGKKATVFATETKKRNGSTKEVINVSVKYHSSNLPSVFILQSVEQSDIAIKKIMAKGIQLGAPF